MTQDAPPTPQHRVGRIGGRPSQDHDVTTSRSPFNTRSRLTLPSGRQPRQEHPAASSSDYALVTTATTSTRSGRSGTPSRRERVQRRPQALGTSRTCALGCATSRAIRLKEGGLSPTGATASPNSAHSDAVRARWRSCEGAPKGARPNQRTSAACACGAAARTSKSTRGCGISWQERQGQRLPNPVPGPSRGP